MKNTLKTILLLVTPIILVVPAQARNTPTTIAQIQKALSNTGIQVPGKNETINILSLCNAIKNPEQKKPQTINEEAREEQEKEEALSCSFYTMNCKSFVEAMFNNVIIKTKTQSAPGFLNKAINKTTQLIVVKELEKQVRPIFKLVNKISIAKENDANFNIKEYAKEVHDLLLGFFKQAKGAAVAPTKSNPILEMHQDTIAGLAKNLDQLLAQPAFASNPLVQLIIKHKLTSMLLNPGQDHTLAQKNLINELGFIFISPEKSFNLLAGACQLLSKK